MTGSSLAFVEKLFVGWFGPRGLASILFVLLVLEHAQIVQETLVFNTVIVTVAMSVVLHGLTALPGVSAYATAVYLCPGPDDTVNSGKICPAAR